MVTHYFTTLATEYNNYFIKSHITLKVFQRFDYLSVAIIWSESYNVQLFHFNLVPRPQRKAGYWAQEARGAKE